MQMRRYVQLEKQEKNAHIASKHQLGVQERKQANY